MVAEFQCRCLSLGIFGQSQNRFLASTNGIFVNPGCAGCNTPYDAGGCRHANSPHRSPMMDPEVNELVHTALLMLSAMNYLLVQDHLKSTNRLALSLVANTGPFSHDPLQNRGREVPPVSLVLGLMDNCSHAFPKIAQNAAGMLSLLICTNPFATMSCLDGKAFVESVFNYLAGVFGLVHNSECLVEEYYGVVAFLNILPACYHFGMWNEAKSSPQFNIFVASFTSLILNITHGATSRVENSENADEAGVDAITDPPKDLETLPELLSAKVFWESLLLAKDESSDQSLPRDWRVQLLHQRPRTFAVMASLEVLGWWSAKGIDLSRAEIPVNSGPSGEIKDHLEEYLPRIRLLVRGSPQEQVLSKYIERILTAILNKRKPKVPRPNLSLLYGPFFCDSRRCGLCHKTQEEAGAVLFSCGGGCCGLEQYCCKKHQREDWKKHKIWCKRNGSFSQHGT